MHEPLRSQLDELLTVYDLKKQASNKQVQRRRDEEDAFVQSFRLLRAGILRPTLHEFGETLRQRGHDYWVAEEDESIGRDNRPRSARIILTLTLANDTARPGYSPAVAFAASRRRRKVCVYVRIPPANDSSSTPRAEYALEEITVRVVEAELVKALREILGR